VLDLRQHDQAWVRDQLGDRWLGFNEQQLDDWLRTAGLDQVRVTVGAHLRGDPFTVLVASGKRPLTRASHAGRRAAGAAAQGIQR
jgi:hypothetical protein